MNTGKLFITTDEHGKTPEVYPILQLVAFSDCNGFGWGPVTTRSPSLRSRVYLCSSVLKMAFVSRACF